MRDFASYVNNQRLPDKRGVSMRRDIDWWMEFVASKLAKCLFLLLLAAMLLLGKLFGQLAQDASRFPINDITLKGEIKITTAEKIHAALQPFNQTSFFGVDVNAVSASLHELPWIQQVSVERAWPDQLLIHVSEYDARYRWGDGYLLDASGSRFPNSGHQAFAALPLLIGPDGFESMVIDAYEKVEAVFLPIAAAKGQLPLKQLVLTPYLSWELHLDKQVVVKFGRDQFGERLQRFAEAYQVGKIPELEKLQTIDFRYRSGFAVKWQPAFAPKSNEAELIDASHTEI